MKHAVRNLAGENWIDPAAARAVPVWNPSTGEQIAETPLCNSTDVDRAVASAVTAFDSWSATPPVDRTRVMFRFRELLERPRSSRRSTDIARALEFCRRVLPRKAVLFLISDFLDDGYLDVLRHTNRKHDLVAVRVSDRREREFENVGLLTLEDAETGRTRLVDTASREFQASLQADARERQAALDRDLRSSGIDVMNIDPTRSVVEPLLAFFRMREKRARR